MMVRLAVFVVAGYVIYAALLFVMQRRIVFPTHLIPDPGEPRLPVGAESMWLPVDGGNVEAWFLPSTTGTGASPLAIFAHGNGELIDYWADELAALRDHGIGVLLVEYPGYGRSGGAPSLRTIEQGFVAAYDAVVARPDVDRDRVLAVGRSLGGGVVTRLATRRPVRALVLLSTFTHARRLARRFLVPGVMVRDPFDNLAVVKAFDGPVFVAHGRADEVIPFEEGRRLAGAALHGEFQPLPCGHNDCRLGRPFWDDVAGFLRRHRVL